MTRAVRSEKGQAAPLYITAVVGLLFLALLFFAFGKADAARNSTQSAADAAALAAAQESRDQLRNGFLENILDGDYLRDILDGNQIGTYNGCQAAVRFAELNDAELDPDKVSCAQLNDGRWGFTVNVVSKKSMGDTILPGTEKKHAKATATAVVEPRCQFDPNEDDQATPSPDESDDPPGNGDDNKPSPGKIVCDGKDWPIDPKNLDLLPDMADLFTVRLADN
ncbi:pilus assembly protein TadG-related protein [Streptomyces sp. NPDC002896]|uniref:pilus assembly protein TadG-related protein n=1 Tax=Streptomyces sp. NPDC002896 TaxID=3154438 RepID=UPI003317EA39